MGRRPKNIDEKTLRGLAEIHCTLEEMEHVLGVDRNTLSRHRWRKIIDEERANGKRSLRRQQFDRAASGDSTMLIWLGKQLLDQRDGAADTDNAPLRLEIEVVTRPASGEGAAREAANG